MSDVAATLGDLLYADVSKARVSEADWQALLDAVVAGQVQGLKALYERSGTLVFTLALQITRDRRAAEEATLDVFEEIWLRAREYDPAAGSVLGWIMNMARLRCAEVATSSDSESSEVTHHPGKPLSTIKNRIRWGLAKLRVSPSRERTP